MITSATSRSEERQSNILNVASEMFLQHGYDAVSLDDILKRVGGSKTTLYSYYGDKCGLFGAVVKKICHDKLAPLRELEVAHLDPKGGLNAIGRCFLTCISDKKGRSFYRMMIAESERFPSLAAEFFALGPESVQLLVRKNLEEWQKKGMLRSNPPAVLAVQFVGIMLGDFSARCLFGLSPVLSEKEIRDWVSGGVDLFLEGASSRNM